MLQKKEVIKLDWQQKSRSGGSRREHGFLTWVTDCGDVTCGLAGWHRRHWAFVACEALHITEPEEMQTSSNTELDSSQKTVSDKCVFSHWPVEVPEDAGAVLADADEDAVGFADKQAGDFTCVSVQVDLRLHLHLWGLRRHIRDHNLSTKMGLAVISLKKNRSIKCFWAQLQKRPSQTEKTLNLAACWWGLMKVSKPLWWLNSNPHLWADWKCVSRATVMWLMKPSVRARRGRLKRAGAGVTGDEWVDRVSVRRRRVRRGRCCGNQPWC